MRDAFSAERARRAAAGTAREANREEWVREKLADGREKRVLELRRDEVREGEEAPQ